MLSAHMLILMKQLTDYFLFFVKKRIRALISKVPNPFDVSSEIHCIHLLNTYLIPYNAFSFIAHYHGI